jgi:hypothetical protein
VYLGFFGSEHFVKTLGGDGEKATEMAVARVTTLNDL